MKPTNKQLFFRFFCLSFLICSAIAGAYFGLSRSIANIFAIVSFFILLKFYAPHNIKGTDWSPIWGAFLGLFVFGLLLLLFSRYF